MKSIVQWNNSHQRCRKAARVNFLVLIIAAQERERKRRGRVGEERPSLCVSLWIGRRDPHPWAVGERERDSAYTATRNALDAKSCVSIFNFSSPLWIDVWWWCGRKRNAADPHFCHAPRLRLLIYTWRRFALCPNRSIPTGWCNKSSFARRAQWVCVYVCVHALHRSSQLENQL